MNRGREKKYLITAEEFSVGDLDVQRVDHLFDSRTV